MNMIAQIAEDHRFDLPTGTLQIRVHDARWDFDTCMGVGARHNPKRGFLFVSKLLGKHIPVHPGLMHAVHHALADQLMGDLRNEATLFVAMAETATGLGHGVYEAALEQAGEDRPWVFCATTRYRVKDAPCIDFREEHSHAADQLLHLPKTPVTLAQIKTLVLVDDEISTGKTMLNLENSLREHLPSLQRVLWVTLTCLANETARPCAYLLAGRYQFEAGVLGEMPGNAVGTSEDVSHKLSAHWGRLGLMGPAKLGPQTHRYLAAQADAWTRASKPILVLGQGEFMHASFRVGRELERLGVNCLVQSTTRSPIMVYGAIGCALAVPDPVGNGVNHYVYNLDPADYQHIVIVTEHKDSAESQALADLLGNATVLAVDL